MIARTRSRNDLRASMRAAEQAGAADVAAYRQQPTLLPQLPLGAFHAAGMDEALMRRLLLALHIPSGLLLAAVSLLRRLCDTSTFDDALHRYAYWHGAKRALQDGDTWQRLASGVRILMYHACGETGEPASLYVIPAVRFARHMAWLKLFGYRVIRLSACLSDLRAGRLPPARAVVITFDDGYADNCSLAYPILRRYQYPATIFLVSGAVDRTNDWDGAPLHGRPMLSRENIGEMMNHDIEFGAHSRAHKMLTQLSEEALRDEVAGARRDLEQAFGQPPLTFAYPGGRFNTAVQAAAESAGYLGACASLSGVNDPATPPHALRRLEMRGNNTSLWSFLCTFWLGRGRLRPSRRTRAMNGDQQA
jgi:peptidoglycan/xylan/chitin deacetylase (PgdA/CDA1 family)